MKPYFDGDGITLYHGDSRDVIPGLAMQAVSTVLTDPPYGMEYCSNYRKTKHAPIPGDGNTAVRDEVLALLRMDAQMVFGHWRYPRPQGTRFVLYWDKGDWPGMGDLSMPWGPSVEEIYVIGRGFHGKRSGQIVRDPKRLKGDHPTIKPVGLLTLLLYKCPAGTTIDPFAGSGSTLLAAREMGRRCIGIEVEERYCEIAARQLSQRTLFGLSK